MLTKSNLIRPILVLVFIFAFVLTGFADTIRLKDGGIVKGKIISFGNGQFVIVIGEGNRQKQLIFRADEVESINFDNGSSPVSIVKTSEPNVTTKSEGNNTVITVKKDNDPVASNSNNQKADKNPVKDNSEETSPSNSSTKMDPIVLNVKVLADNTSNGWTNSGWVVRKGQHIHISGSGRVSLGNGQYSTPAGLSSLPDNNKLVKTGATGGLIAVIGDDNNDFIFVGNDIDFVAQRDGALFLGVNEGNLEDNSGAFSIKVEIDPLTR